MINIERIKFKENSKDLIYFSCMLVLKLVALLFTIDKRVSTVSVHEKAIASACEKVIASVCEKAIASVCGKGIASACEKVITCACEKVIASPHEKAIASVDPGDRSMIDKERINSQLSLSHEKAIAFVDPRVVDQ